MKTIVTLGEITIVVIEKYKNNPIVLKVYIYMGYTSSVSQFCVVPGSCG